jgi:large subunit ribosomal protein L21
VTVHGKILRQARTRKLAVVKYRAKSRYRRMIGHRQYFTEVEITGVGA